MKPLPLVSFIIPTYNEETNINACLQSIYRQNYPKDKIEVIVVDDTSSDKTVVIAKSYPVKIISHNSRHGEIGKMIGFRKARGKYAIYLDADVELKYKDWIHKMIKPLEEDSLIIGTCTRKYSKKSFPPIERYYCFDPLQRDSIYQFFSPSIEDTILEKRNGYYLCKYVEGKIPPSGRCLYRRKELLRVVKDYDAFLELDFLVLLTRNGFQKFAYVPSAGLYHHHVSDLGELVRKRRYNVSKVYLMKDRKVLYKWFDLSKTKDKLKIIYWSVYANLILPSIFVGIYKSWKYRDTAGMYEPIINLIVTDIIIFSFLTKPKSFLNANYAK